MEPAPCQRVAQRPSDRLRVRDLQHLHLGPTRTRGSAHRIQDRSDLRLAIQRNTRGLPLIGGADRHQDLQRTRRRCWHPHRPIRDPAVHPNCPMTGRHRPIG